LLPSLSRAPEEYPRVTPITTTNGQNIWTKVQSDILRTDKRQVRDGKTPR